MALIYRGDTADIEAQLTVDDVAQNLTGAAVVSKWTSPSGALSAPAVTITTAVSGVVTISLTVNETQTLELGEHSIKFVVTFAGGKVRTFPEPKRDPVIAEVFDR